MPQGVEKSPKTLVVEGGAIVLSILLAFAIDAWWDERKERAEEREVIESLYIEFQANREEAAVVVAAHETAVSAVATFLAMSDDEILAMPIAEIQSHVRYFANPRTFDAVRGTVDALASAGKLGILTDRKLREALTTFINLLEDASEDRFYMAEMSLTVWNEIARSGGPWRRAYAGVSVDDCAGPRPPRLCYMSERLAYMPSATPQDMLRLRNNSVLMGYVMQAKVNAMHYAGEIRQAEFQIEIILKQLEAKL